MSVSNAMYNMIQVSDIGPRWPSCTNFVVSIIFQESKIRSLVIDKAFPASGINGIMRYRQQVQRQMDAQTNGNLSMT